MKTENRQPQPIPGPVSRGRSRPHGLLTVIALLVLVMGGEASPEGSEFDSTEAYEQIVQNRSEVEVRNAISKLSEHYQEELAAGRISSESNRKLVVKAIPIIIEHMDDTDKEWAMTVFYVLASLQTECPPPKKESWQKWWKRKQEGEGIKWSIPFVPETRKPSGPKTTAMASPISPRVD